MPTPIVTLDTVENAALDIASASGIVSKQFVRPCFVDHIDVGASSKSEALWLASEEIQTQAAAHPLEAARAEMVLTRIFLEPFTDTSAKGRIVYELPQFGGGPPSTYLITDDGEMRTLETNRMPGTHEPLVCTWVDPVASSGSGGGDVHNTITDRITYTIMAPLRVINVSALIYGRPNDGFQEAITFANDASWPTSAYPGGTDGLNPKGKGFWRLDKYRTTYSRWGGYFQLEAQASTKVVEDWSETGTLRNVQTGRYVKVDPADLTALLAPDYSFGVTNGNGIQRVGFYSLINFVDLFGF